MAANPSPNPYGIDIGSALAAAMAGASSPTSVLNSAAAAVAAGGGTPFDQWVAQFGFQVKAAQAKGPRVSSYGTSTTIAPPVYMGQGHVTGPGHVGAEYDPATHGKTGYVRPGKKQPADSLTTTDAAKNMPATWSTDEVAAEIKKMQDMGFNVSNYDDMVNVWSAAVDRASSTYIATDGKTKLTPWDALSLYGQEMQASGVKPAGPFTGTKTQVSRSVSDISEGQAWSVLQSNLSQMLGRDPSDEEVRDFAYRMNALAARNPSISKTVQQYKAGDLTSSTTHTDPGFTAEDAQHAAYENAQADPDYGAYQAASGYFNAAMSALGPIGSVG